jgi:hypothetical protein
MARSRNIKPSIMENEDLADLDPIARLLFIYLWMLADREGRLEDRPKRIAGRALPYDRDADVDDLLNQLAGAGFITRYSVGDRALIQINNFTKHQSPHVRETASELPCMEQGTTKAVTKHNLGNAEALPRSPDSLFLIPDSPFLIAEVAADAAVTGKPATQEKPACPTEEIVRLYHEAMPNNPKVKVLNDHRRKTIRARWKDAASLQCKPFGYSSREDGLAAWRQFFEVCADSDFLTGRAPAQPGKPPFVADIDFLMSPAGFAKCLENKYHREAA